MLYRPWRRRVDAKREKLALNLDLDLDRSQTEGEPDVSVDVEKSVTECKGSATQQDVRTLID